MHARLRLLQRKDHVLFRAVHHHQDGLPAGREEGGAFHQVPHLAVAGRRNHEGRHRTGNPAGAGRDEAGKLAYEENVSYIIAIGGGSALDAAKTAALVSKNPSLNEEDIYGLNWKEKPLPLIAIGTTAGTGSEVTSVSVMTNKEGIKKSIHHEELYPIYSFGDPSFTKSMPENVRISTAVDALAHLTESYFSNKADPISIAYSMQGIRMLYPELKKLQKHEILNNEDYQNIYNASLIGGMAINITGTVFCHTLGYYFTENYHLPHGFACAIFTDDLIDYEDQYHKEYTKNFFETLQIDKEEFKETISSLLPAYEFHLSEEEIQKILPRYENNNSVKNTYGSMNITDIEKVLRKLP